MRPPFKTRRERLERHHVRRMAAFVLVVLAVILAVRGYRFWWSP